MNRLLTLMVQRNIRGLETSKGLIFAVWEWFEGSLMGRIRELAMFTTAFCIYVQASVLHGEQDYVYPQELFFYRSFMDQIPFNQSPFWSCILETLKNKPHKPHNASAPYPTMYHFVTEMCNTLHFCYGIRDCCIVWFVQRNPNAICASYTELKDE